MCFLIIINIYSTWFKYIFLNAKTARNELYWVDFHIASIKQPYGNFFWFKRKRFIDPTNKGIISM